MLLFLSLQKNSPKKAKLRNCQIESEESRSSNINESMKEVGEETTAANDAEN